MENEYLAVTIGTGADADGGRGDLRRDHAGDFARDFFEVDIGDTSAVEGDRVAHKVLDGGEILALHFVATRHVYGLRGQDYEFTCSAATGYGSFTPSRLAISL